MIIYIPIAILCSENDIDVGIVDAILVLPFALYSIRRIRRLRDRFRNK